MEGEEKEWEIKGGGGNVFERGERESGGERGRELMRVERMKIEDNKS